MTDRPVYQPPPSRCPGCGQINDRATGIIGDRAPRRGSLSICVACGFLGIFDEALVLRRPTDAEALEVSLSEIGPLIERAQRMIRSERGGSRPPRRGR